MCAVTSVPLTHYKHYKHLAPSREAERNILLSLMPSMLLPICSTFRASHIVPKHEITLRVCSVASKNCSIRESFSTNDILISLFKKYHDRDMDRFLKKLEECKDFDAIDKFFRNKFFPLFREHVKKNQKILLRLLCNDLITHSELMVRSNALKGLITIPKFIHFLFLCLNSLNSEEETKESEEASSKEFSELYERLLRTNLWVIYSQHHVQPQIWQLNFFARILKFPNGAQIFFDTLTIWSSASQKALPLLQDNPRLRFSPVASSLSSSLSGPCITNSLIILTIRLFATLFEKRPTSERTSDGHVEHFPHDCSFDSRSLIPLLPMIFRKELLLGTSFCDIFDTSEDIKTLLRVFSCFPESTLPNPYKDSRVFAELGLTTLQLWYSYFQFDLNEFFVSLTETNRVRYLDKYKGSHEELLWHLSIDCSSEELERILITMTPERRRNLISWHLEGLDGVLETDSDDEDEIDMERPFLTTRSFLLRARLIGNPEVSEAIANCLVTTAFNKVTSHNPRRFIFDPMKSHARLEAIAMVLRFFDRAGLYSPASHSQSFFNSFFSFESDRTFLDNHMFPFLDSYDYTLAEVDPDESRYKYTSLDIVEQVFLYCPDPSRAFLREMEASQDLVYLNATFTHLVRNYYNLDGEDQEHLKTRLQKMFVGHLTTTAGTYQERIALLDSPSAYFHSLSTKQQIPFVVSLTFPIVSKEVKKTRKNIIEKIFFSILTRLRDEELKVKAEGLLAHAVELQNFLKNLESATIKNLFKLILVTTRESDEKKSGEVRLIPHPLLLPFITKFFVHTFMHYPDFFKVLVRFDSRLFTFFEMCKLHKVDLDRDIILEIFCQMIENQFLDSQFATFIEKAETDDFYYNLYLITLDIFGELFLTRDSCGELIFTTDSFGEPILTIFAKVVNARPHLTRVGSALLDRLKAKPSSP